MKKYFYFYDLNEILIDRYPAEISRYLTEKYQVENFISIYSEKYNKGTPRNIPEGEKAFFIPNLSLTKINELIAEYPPVALITFAQRIPDMLMLSLFNNKQIPTFIVQHGLWSDRLVRIPMVILLLSKFKKFLYYINYTLKASRLNNLSFILLLIDLYKFLLLEKITIPETNCLKSKNMRARKAFVFDSSWDDYYVVKYGYKKENLIYIGNPDFLIIKKKDLSKKEDAVCYICQTLVEDGRYLQKKHEEFLKILNNTVPAEKKLYIKLHPRSRKELYEVFKSNSNVELTEDFPICEYYIGHYSGMLAIAKQCSDNIYIWDFADHYTPPYFYQFASMVGNDSVSLRKFIKGECKSETKSSIHRLTKKELENFNPIKTISENLVKLI